MDDNSTNPPAPTNPDDVQDKAVEVSQDMVDGQAAAPAADSAAPATPDSGDASMGGPAPAPMSEPEAPAPEAPAEPAEENNAPESTPPAV